MKQYFLFASIFCAISLIFISCVDDDDNHAEATVSFQGVLTQLNYTINDINPENPQNSDEENSSEEEGEDNDTYDFTEAISKAFDDLTLTGAKSVIEESAKVSEGSIAYAQYVCAVQAAEKIQKKLDNVSISDIKELVFNNFTSEMIQLGYNSALDIPLSSITVQISYYSSASYNEPIVFDKVF